MAAEKVGDARCPLCGGTARVSLAKSQLVVMTMNCCNAQLFTRSDRSDMLVRAMLLKPSAAPVVEPEKTPAAVPVPAVPVQEKTETKKPGFTWGVLSHG